MSETTDLQAALQQVRRLSDAVDENATTDEDVDELHAFLEDVETALLVADGE